MKRACPSPPHHYNFDNSPKNCTIGWSIINELNTTITINDKLAELVVPSKATCPYILTSAEQYFQLSVLREIFKIILL